MQHPPAARTRVLAARALPVAALLTATACSAGHPELPGTASSAAASAGRSPAALAPPTAPPPLTEDGARDALIAPGDLGERWRPTQGAAAWRDGLLKATAEDPDCRRLLDLLYTEEFLGPPAGARAVAGFDDAGGAAQLRYQVAAHRVADVDRALAWFAGLPVRCGRFPAVTAHGAEQDVEVDELPLPEVGDARQGLRVTLSGETAGGEPSFLVVEVAAVRVGEDTITLTNGGPGEVPEEATWRAVRAGAERLTEVRRRSGTEV
ncbi:hypothetical protein [Streptomyces glaucus]|uniref:Secreted protein n=1 Tax=Streptomyces glaucus TaxID=284029 RepID=A0ABP5XBH9_9ACTN